MHSVLLAYALLTSRWAAIVLPSDPSDAELAQNLSDVLVATVADRTHAELVGREELRAQLGLSDRGVLGCASDTVCLGRVGVQLRVERMVMGTVARGVGDEYIINLNLVNVSQLRTERGELRKANGVPELVSQVQAIANLFTGAPPAPEVAQPPPAHLAEPVLVGVHERPARYRTAAWTLLGVGGASAIVALFAGGAAHSKATDLAGQANPASPPLFDTRLQQMQTDGQNLEKASKFLWGVGLVA